MNVLRPVAAWRSSLAVNPVFNSVSQETWHHLNFKYGELGPI